MARQPIRAALLLVLLTTALLSCDQKPAGAASPPSPPRPGTRQDPPNPAESAPDYFPLTVGMKWVYERDGKAWNVDVEKSEAIRGKDCVDLMLRLPNGESIEQELFVSKDEKGVYLHRHMEALEENIAASNDYDPPLMIVQFPLKKGDRWTAPHKNPSGEADDWTFENGGEEDVKTPSGTLKAFKISETHGRVTLWLAKNVGIVKRTYPLKANNKEITLMLKEVKRP